MSWLARNLFSRKRSDSQATDESKSSPGSADGREFAAAESDDLGPPPTDDEIANVDALFARLSVAEMRRYQQRLRAHVEGTRRQMRRVAGEHYPALIDAADSVAAMRAAAADAAGELDRLRAMLQGAASQSQLDGSPHAPGTASPARSDDGASARVYAVAAQVKVLVDTPEQIWKALGQQRSLQAALLFLIAQEIHSRLCSQSQSADALDPLLAFPVIERQWASVAPFGEQVAARAHAALTGADASPEVCAGAVCAIALLEDADAEMACTAFLARRAQTLQPALAALTAPAGDGDVAALEAALCELLGRARQILADYVALFGVAEGARRRYASRVLTTLASICADAELPTAPAPTRLGVAASDKRRSQLGSISARRRKSSLAGMVLSSTLPVSPLADTFGFDSVRSPRPADSPASNSTPAALDGARPATNGVNTSIFIITKYLPQEIGQFRPRLPRMLDSCVLAPDGDALDEADEDESGLAALLADPAALLRALATHAQPGLERIAAHSLHLWWAETVQAVKEAAAQAIARHVQHVADAARVSAAVGAWERDGALPWMRDRVWAADAMVADAAGGGALYAVAVEPLLVQRARDLQGSAVERVLELPDAFVRTADVRDVLAGHLPWRPLAITAGDDSDKADVASLRADVSAGLDFEPAAAQALGTAVGSGLRQSWAEAEAWWQQMGGAAVAPESAACAAYVAARWAAMSARLEQWADATAAEALEAVRVQERAVLDGELDGQCALMPDAVVRCVKGVWAARVLADVSRQLGSDELPALLRACWREQPDAAAATTRLQSVGSALLAPWLQHLGSSLALAWAAQFRQLYFAIPPAQRQDAPATRRDVVHAWRVSLDAGAWSARYAALRRVAVATTRGSHALGGGVSAGVRVLAAQLDMRVQTVRGLSALAGAAELRRVGAAFAQTADAVVADREQQQQAAGEWDRAQLAADIRFLLQRLGQPAAASEAVHLKALLQPAIG